MLKSIVAVVALAVVPVIVHAEGGPPIDPSSPSSPHRAASASDGPLVSERFGLVTDAAPGLLGSRYVRIEQAMFCRPAAGSTIATMRIVVLDASNGQRIDTTVRCPRQDNGVQLARYAPELHRAGWFYPVRTDHNPFNSDRDAKRYIHHEVYDNTYDGYYVEQDLESGKCDPPVRLFQSTGYSDEYQATKIALASDDHTLDISYKEARADLRSTSNIVRIDLATHDVKPIISVTAATVLDVYWSASHHWIALAGWLDKFESNYDPATVIFVAPDAGIRFQLPSASTVFDVAFDEARRAAYIGAGATGDIWRVDLGKQRIDLRRGGFGLINSIWVRPDQPQLAVLPSYPDYIAAGLDLGHPVRHGYKPLFGTDVAFPWSYAMASSADGRYVIYTFLDQAAVLTWR